MIRIDLKGGAAVASGLQELSTRLSRKVLRTALEDAAEPMRAAASAKAPRAPGAPDLAENIVISNARPADGSVGIAVGPSKPFFYGWFQEFGTSRHGAQPFLRPAFDSEVERTARAVKDAAWRELMRRGIVGSRGSSTGGGLL